MSPRAWSLFERFALVALIALCVGWEAWLAPTQAFGPWLALKAAPLLFAVPGVFRARRYTSQWLSMLVLLYFVEGTWRLADPGTMGALAWSEIALSVTLYAAAVGHAHATAPSKM